jgi:hypothetical protein
VATRVHSKRHHQQRNDQLTRRNAFVFEGFETTGGYEKDAGARRWDVTRASAARRAGDELPSGAGVWELPIPSLHLSAHTGHGAGRLTRHRGAHGDQTSRDHGDTAGDTTITRVGEKRRVMPCDENGALQRKDCMRAA